MTSAGPRRVEKSGTDACSLLPVPQFTDGLCRRAGFLSCYSKDLCPVFTVTPLFILFYFYCNPPVLSLLDTPCIQRPTVLSLNVPVIHFADKLRCSGFFNDQVDYFLEIIFLLEHNIVQPVP